MRISVPRLGLILGLALLLRLLLGLYLWRDPSFALQQDNYADFAAAILKGRLSPPDFPTVDTRLFPGLPVLIAPLTPLFGSPVTAGIFLSIVASLAAIYLFYLLTNSILLTSIFAFFPPVWVRQGIKVATEPITAALFLLAIFLFLRRRSFWSGLVLGYSLSVRLIALPLFLALLFIRRDRSFLLGFCSLILLTPVLNLLFYGQFGLTPQLLINSQYGRSAFGLTMIISDFIRTLSWGQYRIFASGLFYFLFLVLGQIGLWRARNRSTLHRLLCYWSALSLLFIFSISPTPLIQDLGRYGSVIAPGTILGIYEGLRHHPRQKRS